MAVQNVKSSAVESKPEPKSSDQLLELTGAQRLAHGGHLYLSGTPYKVSEAQAQAMLTLSIEGKRMFAVYVAPKSASASEPKAPEKITAAPPVPVKNFTPAPPPKRLDVTTPEEEAELGLPPADQTI